ncbi:MAG: hypothetical protein AAF585_24505, partial [Verrucomicrobiota bacterium]
PMNRDRALDLIFIDTPNGDRTIPNGFWSRFQVVSALEKTAPVLQFRYLVRWKLPEAELERRLIDAFRELAENRDHLKEMGVGLQELNPLPRETQIRILRNLKTESQNLASKLEENHQSRSLLKDTIPELIDRRLRFLGDPESIDALIIDSPAFADFRKSQLEHEPGSFLVAEFADHANTAIRALALEIAGQHPTPRNRAWLTQLKNDPDPIVAAAREKAETTFTNLRASL